jgi:SAM-dependent methyltransferase
MSYNTTQLNPDTCFERHIYHRDQFAHFLRWTHVLKEAKIGQKILDFGCGSGNLLEVFYRNRYKPLKYVGLDIRQQTINKSNEKWKNLLNFAKFQQADLCSADLNLHEIFDIICSFEVVEHIGKQNIDNFLKNILKHCDDNTKIMISTPCYDENVGAADNHIIDGIIGEFRYQELKFILERYFIIEDYWGTFASQKDYKPFMNDWQLKMFEKLNKYYDSNLLSNLMAPFFPENSRNVLWSLKKK